jgi:hypothetical protein
MASFLGQREERKVKKHFRMSLSFGIVLGSQSPPHGSEGLKRLK